MPWGELPGQTGRAALRDGTEYGVIYDRGAWGKANLHRVYFDTQVAADAISRVVAPQPS